MCVDIYMHEVPPLQAGIARAKQNLWIGYAPCRTMGNMSLWVCYFLNSVVDSYGGLNYMLVHISGNCINFCTMMWMVV